MGIEFLADLLKLIKCILDLRNYDKESSRQFWPKL